MILLTVNSNAVAENGIDFIEDTGVRYGSFYPPRVRRQFAQEATLVKVNHQASLGKYIVLSHRFSLPSHDIGDRWQDPDYRQVYRKVLGVTHTTPPFRP